MVHYSTRGVRHCEGAVRSNPVIYSELFHCATMTKRRIRPREVYDEL
jgi:hypothetical protein